MEVHVNEQKEKLIAQYKEYRKKGYSYKGAYKHILTDVNEWINKLYLSRIKKENSMTLEDLKILSSYVYENIGAWVGAPRVITSDALPLISYDFPKKNGNHPFDIKCEDKYFIDANGFSYSYENYLAELEIIRNRDIHRSIQMGYKVLCSYEKKVFMKNGKIIKTFEQIAEQVEGNDYVIISTSEYLRTEKYSYFPDINQIDHSDYEAVKKTASSLSQADKKGIYLICKTNAKINWH
nr:hypothetical protein [Lysinibacillus timonensis]